MSLASYDAEDSGGGGGVYLCVYVHMCTGCVYHKSTHLADPKFLPVTPLLLRLLELVLTVGEAGFLLEAPRCRCGDSSCVGGGGGGSGIQITRWVSRRGRAGE